MQHKFIIATLVLVLGGSLHALAQSKVIGKGSWNAIGISAPITDKWTFGIKPMSIRTNDFYRDHQQVFTDVTLKYKASPAWSFMILERFVTIPDVQDQIWLFLDANYMYKESDAFFIKNRLRFHYGTDIPRSVNDFLRNQLELHVPITQKITPYLAVEPFFQFNRLNELHRMRYEFGVNWKLFPRWKLGTTYRLEEFYNTTPDRTAHTIVTQLIYLLKSKS